MRRKLTEKMEGRVRLRRWKAMNAGAKISLVFLGFMALLAVLAPLRTIRTRHSARTSSLARMRCGSAPPRST